MSSNNNNQTFQIPPNIRNNKATWNRQSLQAYSGSTLHAIRSSQLLHRSRIHPVSPFSQPVQATTITSSHSEFMDSNTLNAKINGDDAVNEIVELETDKEGPSSVKSSSSFVDTNYRVRRVYSCDTVTFVSCLCRVRVRAVSCPCFIGQTRIIIRVVFVFGKFVSCKFVSDTDTRHGDTDCQVYPKTTKSRRKTNQESAKLQQKSGPTRRKKFWESEKWLQLELAEKLVRTLKRDLGVVPSISDCMEILCEGAVVLTKKLNNHGKSKQTEMKYHFVRQKVEEGHIVVGRISTEENPVDPFTKELTRPKHDYHTEAIGVRLGNIF
ncbi:hypothetical protein LXL04_029401 [Taraxacum kok-saghyz]